MLKHSYHLTFQAGLCVGWNMQAHSFYPLPGILWRTFWQDWRMNCHHVWEMRQTELCWTGCAGKALGEKLIGPDGVGERRQWWAGGWQHGFNLLPLTGRFRRLMDKSSRACVTGLAFQRLSTGPQRNQTLVKVAFLMKADSGLLPCMSASPEPRDSLFSLCGKAS